MEENTVRLVGGTGNNRGFVELNLVGHWVPICPYFWDILDASVVCRELGYLTVVSTTIQRHYNYRYYYRPLNTYTYSCTGDESTLKQCSTSYERRCNYYSAFVYCSGECIQICNAL